MGENVDNRYAADSPKSPSTALSMLDRASTRTRGEVLLPYPRLATQKEIDANREKLQQLKRKNAAAWLLLDTVTREPASGSFGEHSFDRHAGREALQNYLRSWADTSLTSDRIYLQAEANADTPCYDITDYIQRCVDGDLSVADRLKGERSFDCIKQRQRGMIC